MQHLKRALTHARSHRLMASRRVHPATIFSVAVLAVAATSGSVLVGAPVAGPVNTAVETNTVGETGALRMALGTGSAAAAPAAPVPASAPEAPSEKVLGYDLQLQPNYYYCGPASTRIALSGQGITVSQDELAARLGTTVNGTNSSLDIIRVLNAAIGRDAYRVREIRGQAATPAEMDRLQADVVEAVSNGRILVANIIGGATDTSGYVRNFPGGHYITIVGYGDGGRRVQVADPSGVGPATYWMTTIDMAHWIASRGYAH